MKVHREIKSWNLLVAKVDQLNCKDIASVVLDDKRFVKWSGAGIPQHHHYGTNGLLIHTGEVMDLCFKNAETLNIEVNEKVLFLGALFHDYGKCWDYESYVDENTGKTEWRYTDHNKTIGHLPRSLMEWTKAVELYPKYNDIKDEVAHMIISHHGRKEWGSPRTPFTKEAWLLHLCDSLSARIEELR